MGLRVSLLLVLASLLLGAFGHAQMTDDQIAEIIKKRSYEGGADEEELVVQPEDAPDPYRVVNIRNIQNQVYEKVSAELEKEKQSTSIEKAESDN